MAYTSITEAVWMLPPGVGLGEPGCAANDEMVSSFVWVFSESCWRTSRAPAKIGATSAAGTVGVLVENKPGLAGTPPVGGGVTGGVTVPAPSPRFTVRSRNKFLIEVGA